MLIEISYHVTFPVSGITLKGKFQPQTGLTAVVGPNGVGKTFSTIELTRYLLYGKKALRGSASDYSKLTATAIMEIRGARYTVHRGKKEWVQDAAGTELAVGAEAVTAKMTELMGYGLKVFDICNASVQKRADAFGQMKPSERKRMIDEVVNITSYEVVEKACREETKTLKREAEALTKVLRAPDEPEKPEGYEDCATLEARLKAVRQHRDQYRLLERQIVLVPTPVKPDVDCPDPLEVERLEQLDKDYTALTLKQRQLQSIIDSGPKEPVPYTHLELKMARDRNAALVHAKKAVTCPDCGSEFIPGEGSISIPDGPDLTMSQIQEFEQAHHRQLRSKEAQIELYELPKAVDVSSELQKLLDAKRDWLTFDRAMIRYEDQNRSNKALTEALEELGPPIPDSELDALSDAVAASRAYERDLASYQSLIDVFETTSAKIKEAADMAEEFRKGAEAILDARTVLKAMLAPRLSSVASALIQDMTHGKYNEIVVDEDMEITVDGQALETLSGGYETVANIALRIALGQVLVAQTFPVFFGDEMDADADSIRREAVLEAMVSLKDHLKQIILITHRGADVADHIVTLSNP